MPRYKLTIEYDGTHLVGWQRQKEGTSVQSLLEEALAAFTGEEARTTAAGRTDAGVHARGQVVHVDFQREWSCERVLKATNAHLRGSPVAVLDARRVSDTFHARFSALWRAYTYRLIVRPAPLVLDDSRAWWHHSPLNVPAMREAADLLLGTHDFSTFRASECQSKSPIRTLDHLTLDETPLDCFPFKHERAEKSVTASPVEIQFHIRAKSFLHHQVRNIVGSLKLVGTGKWSVTDFQAALEARDRRRGGPTAPACGLTFLHAAYTPSEKEGF